MIKLIIMDLELVLSSLGNYEICQKIDLNNEKQVVVVLIEKQAEFEVGFYTN